MTKNFKALRIEAQEDNHFKRSIQDVTIDELPPGEVLVQVIYSSLNYKDALSAIGNRGVTKHYPHTPGIDAAGIVIESQHPNFPTGSKVIVSGHDFGMNTWGGFSEYVQVPAQWLVLLPTGLTLKESMIYGTAGFTAGLSVYKLMAGGVTPDKGDILVTGGTGGVGSIAISILSKLGYTVYAVTGKADAKDMLLSIGAKDIILRDSMDIASTKPLHSGRWAGVVDTVGGKILATAMKATKYGACVTCCGNVGGYELDTSVYPFILRGNTLFGIDAVQCPQALRRLIWEKIGSEWKLDSLEHHEQVIALEEVSHRIDLMLEGKVKGRSLIKVQEEI